MDTTNLIAYLPFDESATLDLCGNEWTASGSPTISDCALQLASGSYVRSDSITLGAQDFTIHGFCYFDYLSGAWARIFNMSQTDASFSNIIFLGKYSSSNNFTLDISGAYSNFTATFNQRFHFAVVYQHSISTTKCYINGTLKATVTGKTIERLTRKSLIGKSSWSADGIFIGSIDEFMIYDGVALWTEDFTPPTVSDYCSIKFALNAPIVLNYDVERVLANNAYVQTTAPYLIAYLPFNESATQDLCGNEWTTYNSLGISDGKLNFTANAQYLAMTGGIALGGQDFTITGKFNFTSSSSSFARIFSLYNATGTTTGCINLARYSNNSYFYTDCMGTSSPFTPVTLDTEHHFAYCYSHNEGKVRVFFDGVLGISFDKTIARTTFPNVVIGKSSWTSDGYPRGTIDEFQIYDGIALHTANFTPPTAQFYQDLFNYFTADIFTFDVERKIKNNVEVSADIQRKIVHGAEFSADIERQVIRSVDLLNDIERVLSNNITFDVEFSADFERKLKNNVEGYFDTQRQLVHGVELIADTQRQLIHSVNLIADIERQVIRSVELVADVERFFRWRYENPGTADTLIISGTTLTNLPESKSVTGSAFYQTTRAKCFDLPTTSEIWLKFDVYFNGSNRWRAYNQNSNGCNGITAQTSDDLSFFSNDSNVQQLTDICKTNTLQTVLLHMKSGSSDGIIEAWVDGTKIYTYTGDVNHGEDFADIYLQSDGAGTFFSNVIISNVEIKLGEGWHASNSDVEQRIINVAEVVADVERIVTIQGVMEISFDTEVNVLRSVELDADFIRTVQRLVDFDCDVEVFEVIPVEVIEDVARNLLANIILFPIDNSQYFHRQANLLNTLRAPVLRADSPPIEIPSQARPFQANNTQGVQTFEVTLEEQQLTAQVKFTSVIPLEPLQAVFGQFLDYSFAMFVENTRQEGIFLSADCCSNLDELLYSQLNYSVEDDADKFLFDFRTNKFSPYHRNDYSSDSDDEQTTDDEEEKHTQIVKKATALTHMKEIVKQLFNGDENALEPHFTDFVSNLDVEQKDVSFSDLISSLFGWSSRIPNKQINIFACIIDGKEKLFVLERGQEPNSIDISNTKHSTPIIEKSLIRTFCGSSPDSSYTLNIQLPGEYLYPWPPEVSPDGKTHYNYKNVSGYAGIDVGYALQSSVTENDDGSSHRVDYHYDTVHGVYTCVSETHRNYDENGDLVEKKKIIHHRLTPSQQFSRLDDEDGNAISSNVSSNLPGFYNEKITLIEPSTDTQLITIPGNPLVDMSFPFIETEDFERASQELINLNRSIQTTVSLTLYDYPHLITFLDRIFFDGNEYHLVSNSALSSSRIFCKQSIVMRRWN